MKCHDNGLNIMIKREHRHFLTKYKFSIYTAYVCVNVYT